MAEEIIHFDKKGKIYPPIKKNKDNDLQLADEAFLKIQGIFSDHYQSALLEVANYLAETFFNNDIELVKQRKPAPNREESFHQLCYKLKDSSQGAPSKSWLYNALGIFVDEAEYKNFHTYGNLSISHKVKLLTVKDEKDKKALIQEAVDKEYSVRELQRIISKRKHDFKIKKKENRHGKYGTKEWAEKNANCCWGCTNNCRYCYGRLEALRYKRVEKYGDWQNMTVNDSKVLKRYKKKIDGRYMFPSTHDITPQNIYPCLIVLENLLKAENEVLIVTKPVLSCIEKICKYLGPHKKNILFRFTIGARDEEILKFWEPNAPTFAERMESLKHATEKGFKTSVSIEPMLDPSNIDDLLYEFSDINLESIWVGTMSQIGHILGIQKDQDAKNRINVFRKNLKDDIILAIYDRWRHDERIKWKESIMNIVKR